MSSLRTLIGPSELRAAPALEDEGWEAVPIFPNPPEIAPAGVAVVPGRPAPNVFPDFNYAAVAAGLCEISYNDIPFSETYGSRQRFHMIITDAEIEGTPLLEAAVCMGCKKCAEACPLGAISMTETDAEEICGYAKTVPSRTACPRRASPTVLPHCATVPA